MLLLNWGRLMCNLSKMFWETQRRELELHKFKFPKTLHSFEHKPVLIVETTNLDQGNHLT